MTKKYDRYTRLVTQCGSVSSSTYKRDQCTRADLLEDRSRNSKAPHCAAFPHHFRNSSSIVSQVLGRLFFFLIAEIA